jgi:uncharacterized protein (DUF2062 family)
MLFKRRENPGLWDRFRLWLWPRVSWRRSGLYYLKRILRLSGTPYAIAMGTAVGVFASFTPFVGLHIVITLALAWLFGANMIAGGIATAVGNPLTFPLIWASTYELGHVILGGVNSAAPARLGDELASWNFDQILPLLKPMLVGSITLGAAAGLLAYLVVYKAVSAYQEARRKRAATRNGGARMAESGQKP